MPTKNSNWTETNEGWVRNENSHQKGNADYFNRPIPSTRDSADRPLRGDGSIDTAKWIQESNNGTWQPK